MRFSSIQEQEHWDHEAGCASEHQNAYALSHMELPPDDSGKIRNWKAKGKFQVVEWFNRYCNFTDAFLARQYRLRSVHPTEALAQSALEREYGSEDNWEYDDGGVFVLRPDGHFR